MWCVAVESSCISAADADVRAIMASSSSDLAKANHDTESLTLVAERLGSPPAKQAKKRLKHYVIMSRKDQAWTSKEDAILLEAYSRLGNKWTAIATMLKGRTDNAVKNRHALLQRKKHGELNIDKDIGRKRARGYSDTQGIPYNLPRDPAAYVPPSEFYSPRPSPLSDTLAHRSLYPPHPFPPYLDPAAYLRPPAAALPPHAGGIMSYTHGNPMRGLPSDIAAHGYAHAFEAIAGLDMQAELRGRYSMQALEYYHRQAALGATGILQNLESHVHVPQEGSTGQNM